MSPSKIARVIVWFGLFLSMTGILEFLLLKFSPTGLELWRNLIIGTSIGPASETNDVMLVGGVSLTDEGLSRVGGLIGAPENFGMALAFSLLFLAISNFSARFHLLLFSAYIVDAILAGSRSLGITLALYSFLMVSQIKVRNVSLKSVTIFAWIGVVCAVLWFGLNTESFERYGLERIVYEFTWRQNALDVVLDSLREGSVVSWLGVGIGWGAEEPFGWQWNLSSGLLGGDWAIAFGLGGVVGVALLTWLWITVLRLWRDLGKWNINRLGLTVYICFIAFMSLLMSQFTNWFVYSGFLTFLPISLLVTHEGLLVQARKAAAREQQPGAE